MAAPKVGGGDRIVSRVRAPSGNEKLLSVVRERESAGPKIFGHGNQMRDARTKGACLISLQRATRLE
jgi:hypothetical protein